MAPYMLVVKKGDETVAFVKKNGMPCGRPADAMKLHFRENIEYYQAKYASFYKADCKLVIESAPQ